MTQIETGYASAPGLFGDGRQPMSDLMEYLHDYSREKPEVVALWAFALGFYLGWKLKPW